MRKLQFAIVAVALLSVVSSCMELTRHPRDMHENWYRRHHPNLTVNPAMGKWCEGLRCNRVLNLDKNGQWSDDSGTPITNVDALIGTHICFYNKTGCELALKFGNVLFGASHATTIIRTGECATLLVTREAAKGIFSIEPVAECLEGGGHTNPTVRVGDGEEDGGG